MPLAGSTITGVKGLATGYQPILAYVFEFMDGSFLRVATHPLNTAEGGAVPTVSGWAHSGEDFLGRIAEQDLDAIQSISEHGIDHVSSVGIHLHDPDKLIYQNYEVVNGFKGATVTAYFLFYDIELGTFSSDVDTKFIGICNAPSSDPLSLNITATAKTNLQKIQLPQVRIQRQCPWVNPKTLAQRAVAGDEDSEFYECGETRDLTTAPPCSNTKETCTQPTRFRGVGFSPIDRWQSRGYLDGKTIEGANSPNDSKYGEATPMIYGTTWIEPPIMNVIGDANSTRMEVMLTLGNLGGSGTTNPGRVLIVEVNDYQVPFVAYSTDKPIWRWEWVSTGARDGAVNADAGYDSKGDPYGSTAVIEIVVYRKLAQSESLPRVRVLTGGPAIRVYTDASTYTTVVSSNPVWVLLDLLTWANLKYADIDLASFVMVAGVCSTVIDYKDFADVTQSHERFDSSLAIRGRKSAAELVRGVLRSINSNLVLYQGKYRLQQRSTLAEQQPSAVTGSNYGTAVSSVLLDGTSANGYVAWDFGEGDYIRDKDGAADFKVVGRPISDSPNKVSCQIQDKHNSYVLDAYQVTDSDDVERAQQEVSTGIEVLGINSYDHAYRVGNTYLAEIHRGNSRGDTGGTEIYEFPTSVKCVHLRLGQIIRVSNVQYGITNQLARVIQIQPSKNWEIVKIRASFHADEWYTDTYGQKRSPAPNGAGSDAKSRPPYPWQPNAAAPPTADAMFDPSELNFAVEQSYVADAASSAVATVAVRGVAPVTALSSLKAPAIGLQMTAAGSGGSLVGGGWQYWAVVCGVDAAGKLTAPSKVASAVIVAGGSAYTLTIDVAQWPDDIVGYQAFLARDASMRFAFQVSGGTTPSTITFTDYDAATYGPPDTEARKLLIRSKLIEYSGVWKLPCTAVGTNTLTFTGEAWTTNEWANYTISLIAKDAAGEQAIYNATVTSNTADELTLAIDPDGTVQIGDVIVMRSKPSVSGSTLTDAQWANSSGLVSGLTVDALVGRELWVISGPGRGYRYLVASNTDDSVTIEGSFTVAPTTDSRYIICSAGWLKETAESELTGNADPAQETTLKLEYANYAGQAILLAGFIVGDGKESLDNLSPIREIYLTGATGASFTDAPPGPIGTITADAPDYTDPANVLLKGTAPLPGTLNDFDGCMAYAVNTVGSDPPVALGHSSHPVGGAGPFAYKIIFPRPSVNENYDIFLASRNARVQAELVIASGAGQTPNFNVSVTARPSSTAPPSAPNVDSVSATVEYDPPSAPKKWRITGTVEFPAATYGDIAWFTLRMNGPIVATVAERQQPFDINVTVPAAGADYDFATDWFDLPLSGSEVYEIDCITENADNFKTGSPTTSSTVTVASGAPAAPTACAVSIVDRKATFALQIVITPAGSLGGTVGYEREARYFNDAGLTTPDSDWIELGWVDAASTTSVTTFWPRPAANQWVKVRVRATTWTGAVTSFVESASAAALTTVAAPTAPTTNTTTVRPKSDNGAMFGLHIVVTPNVSPGTTDWYEVQARYWTDAGLTTPDSEWIPIGGISPTQLTLDTDYWDRPKATQYAKTRVASKNVNGALSSWVESSVLTISPTAAVDNLTSVSAAIVNQGETWGVSGTVVIPASRSLLRSISIYIVGPITGSVDANTRRQQIGDPISIPGSGNITYSSDGKWERPNPQYSESTQSYRVDAVAEDVYGNRLAAVSSTPDFTVAPFSFADYTSISLTPDYNSIDNGSVRITGTATPPVNPLCDGCQVYVSRDGGAVYIDVGHQPKVVGSTSTQSLDFTVDLPAVSTVLKIKLVPTNISGKQPSVDTVSTVTDVTVDPNNQALQSFDGLTQVTLGASTTISRTVGRVGEILVVAMTQDGTGGRIPTWSSDFSGTYPAPWPDVGTKTFFTFICMDSGGGNKWHLVAERYNA